VYGTVHAYVRRAWYLHDAIERGEKEKKLQRKKGIKTLIEAVIKL
jgi:hypothetical protein